MAHDLKSTSKLQRSTSTRQIQNNSSPRHSAPSTNMSESPDSFVPSVRSRHPRSATEQAQLDEAIQWLAADPLVPAQCPAHTVTELINTSTAKGQEILAKYDPIKLETSHGLMRSLERVQFVGELRGDLYLRRAKTRKCEEILAMITTIQSTGGGEGEGKGQGVEEDWQVLEAACQRALENAEQLEERLVWCEENFETGKLTTPELRMWGGATVDIDLEEAERGRSLRRAKPLS